LSNISLSRMRKDKQIFILFILSVGIVITSLNINLFNQSLINDLTDGTSNIKDEPWEYFNKLPLTAQINTTISPSNTINIGNVFRGWNVSYLFNYSDVLTNPIEGAIINVVSLPPGFSYNAIEEGLGNYSINLFTSGVIASATPYTCIFNISSTGNQTQNITFNIRIIAVQTDISILSFSDTLIRKDGLNQTVIFYFNDTDTNSPINGLIDSDLYVKDNQTGTQRPIWLYSTATEGEYILNISISALESGWVQFEINVSLLPNYDWSIEYLVFYLRGNFTQIHLISVSDPGGQLTPQGAYNFTIFEGSDITTELNMTDLEYNNTLVSTLADSYTVRYQNLNTAASGIIASSFQIAALNHRGSITTSNPALVIGNYEINITINKLNYEEASFVLNLTVIQKYQARLTIIKPENVNAGLPFKIIIKAEYYNASVWLPIEDSFITFIPYYNGIAGTSLGPYLTNSTGEVEVEIPTYSDTRTLNLTIQLNSAYYRQESSIEISDIEVIPLLPGLSFEALIPYFIIIGAIVVLVGGSIIVYRRIILPKKRRKPSVLEGVKTIFDDAINLEYLFVLFKKTGSCILYKSFVSEEIHPILISGFISEICSFGKDLDYQEKVNKITSDDKTLLLSDGEYVRVALILNKEVSTIFHRNLIEFLHSFEKNYAIELQNWEWQFNVFINAGTLIDEKLNISINLPHEIAYDISSIKPLKNPYSKDVLKIANELVEESERNFLPITTLLKEVCEKTQRDTTEIFMGIMELRDKKILIPIEIPTIEAQPITQEEMTVIEQKVAALANLTPEEKKKLVDNLAQTGHVERKIYLTSLMEQHEIISAPIEEKLGVTIIDNVKRAKKEIKVLNKIAQLARNERDYEKAINIYRKALKIATEYELARELDQINEFIHSTESEKYFDLNES